MKKNSKSIVPIIRIENKILHIRGHKVMLDRDLAELYGVPTKVFNQAVKRNSRRFPENFMFQLTAEEVDSLRSQTVTLNEDRGVSKKGKHSKYLPNAFTEHGALMSANVLNSERAIDISVMVIEAFIRLREIALTHKELSQKLKELEDRMDMHDENTIVVMSTLRKLLNNSATKVPPPPRKKIGFPTE